MAITVPSKLAVGAGVTKAKLDEIIDALSDLDGLLSAQASYVPNGDFETWVAGDPSNWVAVALSGGSYAEDTGDSSGGSSHSGASSFQATATSGGGYVTLTSEDFFALGYLERIDLAFMYKVSTTAIEIQVDALYYDEDQVALVSGGTQTLIDLDNTTDRLPKTTWDGAFAQLVPPTGTKYGKLKFTLGDGTTAGTTNLDQITMGKAATKGRPYDTAGNRIIWTFAGSTVVQDDWMKVKDEITEVRPIRSVLVEFENYQDASGGNPGFDAGTIYTWDPATQAWVSVHTFSGSTEKPATLRLMCDALGAIRVVHRDDPASASIRFKVLEYEVL